MHTRRAFSLLELLIVLGIMVTVGTALLFEGAGYAERKVIANEDKLLESIRDDIVRSFESEDFDQINVLALTGTIPSGATPTTFAQHNLTGSLGAVSSADWFAKVARLRGVGVTTGTPPAAASQPELYKIAYNAYGRPRALFAAPPEADKQRFVLVSLMGRAEQFAFPAYENNTTWFDALFNTNWNTQQRSTPAAWSSRLASDQLAAWNGTSSTGTNLWRLRVVAFSVSKLPIHLSNGHPTDTLYLTTDGGGTTYTIAPGAAADQSSFAGRTLRVYQGATTNPAARTFVLRKASDIIIE